MLQPRCDLGPGWGPAPLLVFFVFAFVHSDFGCGPAWQGLTADCASAPMNGAIPRSNIQKQIFTKRRTPHIREQSAQAIKAPGLA
jgi:hypothetical protein